ncbi:hypothetical protein AM1_5768 [Acaryochloris marina MBIC11017]|uniref:Uncharacterized protein n=1 Tax=Acaryochloris marina (strain MBIC 11017) TaxID=329726 RepID=B0BZG8_ACAM1|nr:hypothetical protein AM1_5768 [Acaryochloris marina MBIC11017]
MKKTSNLNKLSQKEIIIFILFGKINIFQLVFHQSLNADLLQKNNYA